MSEVGAGGNRRWLVLFIGLIALTAGCTFQYGIAYLIPALRHEGFSLELAGILVAVLGPRHRRDRLQRLVRAGRRDTAGCRRGRAGGLRALGRRGGGRRAYGIRS